MTQTGPRISIIEEDGSETPLRPVTQHAHNRNGHVAANCDPNRHTMYHERDNDGTVLKTIRADLVFKEFIHDIFGNTKTVSDPLKHATNYRHDRCNREIWRQDACLWVSTFRYNELGERLSFTDNAQETERYDYLHPSGQVTHHYLPAGDKYLTRTEYDAHGIMVLEELPDHRTNSWKLDNFGNVISHTDLGGALYTYTLNPNFPTEVASVKSAGGQHGTRLCADGTRSPMANQDIDYQYNEASYLTGIIDNALPLRTFYRLDIAGNRARETFIANDGHIHQAVYTERNALGWISSMRDTLVGSEVHT